MMFLHEDGPPTPTDTQAADIRTSQLHIPPRNSAAMAAISGNPIRITLPKLWTCNCERAQEESTESSLPEWLFYLRGMVEFAPLLSSKPLWRLHAQLKTKCKHLNQLKIQVLFICAMLDPRLPWPTLMQPTPPIWGNHHTIENCDLQIRVPKAGAEFCTLVSAERGRKEMASWLPANWREPEGYPEGSIRGVHVARPHSSVEFRPLTWTVGATVRFCWNFLISNVCNCLIKILTPKCLNKR